MYNMEFLAKAEHLKDLSREAEQELRAAILLEAQHPAASLPKRLAAGTLIWAGRRLTYWGNQLQREYRKPAF